VKQNNEDFMASVFYDFIASQCEAEQWGLYGECVYGLCEVWTNS
jgi:hypothetical protein